MNCVLLSTLALALGSASVAGACVGSSCPVETTPKHQHLTLVQRQASSLRSGTQQQANVSEIEKSGGCVKTLDPIKAGDGYWGAWSPISSCPNHGKITSIQQRVESNQGSGDDSALNAVRFRCEDGTELRSGEGSWGIWSGWASCPADAYVIGYKIKFQPFQGSGGGSADDSTANAVHAKCNDGSVVSPGGDGPSGSWYSAACPQGAFANGFMSRVEGKQGRHDDTAMNALSMSCLSPTPCPTAAPTVAPTAAPTLAPSCTCNAEGTFTNNKDGDWCWLAEDRSDTSCFLQGAKMPVRLAWSRCVQTHLNVSYAHVKCPNAKTPPTVSKPISCRCDSQNTIWSKKSGGWCWGSGSEATTCMTQGGYVMTSTWFWCQDAALPDYVPDTICNAPKTCACTSEMFMGRRRFSWSNNRNWCYVDGSTTYNGRGGSAWGTNCRPDKYTDTKQNIGWLHCNDAPRGMCQYARRRTVRWNDRLGD